jgi:iron complex outermembrane recepter protein
MKQKILFLLFAILIMYASAEAQNRYILQGIVVSEDGKALPQANLLLTNLSIGTATNLNGCFQLTNIPKGKYQLICKYLGYKELNLVILIQKDTSVILKMSPINIQMKEVEIMDNASQNQKRENSLPFIHINKDFLIENEGSSLVQMLEKIPGISALNITSGVSKPMIRGLGFNRVVVTTYGIKQEGQQWGADHGLEIDPNSVENIEITKGPGSLQYGSDAIGGVINIKQPYLTVKDSVEAEVQLKAKSNNNFSGSTAKISLNRNNQLLRIRISGETYGDYSIPADSFEYNNWRLPLHNRKLKNSAGRNLSGEIMLGTLKKWGTAMITISNYYQKIGFFTGAHGMPNVKNLENDGDSYNIDFPYQQVNHLKVIANIYYFKNGKQTEIDAGYQLNHRQEYSYPHTHGLEPQPQGNLEIDFKLHTLSLNIRKELKHNELQTQSTGINIQYQQNTKDGYGFLLPDFNSFSGGVFYLRKHKLSKKLNLQAGIRSDFAKIRIKQYLEPQYDNNAQIIGYFQRSPNLDRTFFNLSGSTGISYQYSEKLIFRTNLGSSYKIPTAVELSSNGVHHGSFRHEMGDSLLKAERAYQFDFSAEFTSSDIEITFSTYLNYFKGYIFLNPSGQFSFLPDAGQIYKYEQADALHTGAELETVMKTGKNLSFRNTLQYVFAQNLETNYPVPFTPPMEWQSSIRYQWIPQSNLFKSVYFETSATITAPQNRVARNEICTPGYTIFHLSTGSELKLFKQTLNINFSVQNILNQTYFNHLSLYRKLNLPESGRNITISILWKIK